MKKIVYLYLDIENLPFGKVRRKIIIDGFKKYPDDDVLYTVNRKYRPQMKNDPDLTKLVKNGTLKLYRSGQRTSRTTYLIRGPNFK